jgi:EmrB/QacA subfamily drug resistance transporter
MTRSQRLILTVSILASFIAFLDGSIVNVALPAIQRSLGGGITGQQWVIDAYLITLGALILIAGSLSDLYGRKLIISSGLIGFGVTSLFCAVSNNIDLLIGARALQGIAGALLVPSSLALITSSFEGSSEAKAIGSWTGWTGLAFIIGPLLGGALVQYVNWRLIFLINVLPIAVTLYLLTKLPSDRHNVDEVRVDILGAVYGAIGLGGTVFGLIEDGRYGVSSPIVYLPFAIGFLIMTVFLHHERRTAAPMLPLKLFRSRNFSAGNLATVAIYAGLSIFTFTLIIFLQQVAKYSALSAGLSFVPTTIIMFVLSPRFGKLSGIYGPRLFMTLGPLIAALGFIGLLRVQAQASYLSQVLPVVVTFALGLSLTVAPLTNAVLGSVPNKQSGIASAINNAVARIAGLVGIAGITIITGTNLNVSGLHKAGVAMSLLLVIGSGISFIGIRNSSLQNAAKGSKIAKPISIS